MAIERSRCRSRHALTEFAVRRGFRWRRQDLGSQTAREKCRNGRWREATEQRLLARRWREQAGTAGRSAAVGLTRSPHPLPKVMCVRVRVRLEPRCGGRRMDMSRCGARRRPDSERRQDHDPPCHCCRANDGACGQAASSRCNNRPSPTSFRARPRRGSFSEPARARSSLLSRSWCGQPGSNWHSRRKRIFVPPRLPPPPPDPRARSWSGLSLGPGPPGCRPRPSSLYTFPPREGGLGSGSPPALTREVSPNLSGSDPAGFPAGTRRLPSPLRLPISPCPHTGTDLARRSAVIKGLSSPCLRGTPDCTRLKGPAPGRSARQDGGVGPDSPYSGGASRLSRGRPCGPGGGSRQRRVAVPDPGLARGRQGRGHRHHPARRQVRDGRSHGDRHRPLVAAGVGDLREARRPAEAGGGARSPAPRAATSATGC